METSVKYEAMRTNKKPLTPASLKCWEAKFQFLHLGKLQVTVVTNQTIGQDRKLVCAWKFLQAPAEDYVLDSSLRSFPLQGKGSVCRGGWGWVQPSAYFWCGGVELGNAKSWLSIAVQSKGNEISSCCSWPTLRMLLHEGMCEIRWINSSFLRGLSRILGPSHSEHRNIYLLNAFL